MTQTERMSQDEYNRQRNEFAANLDLPKDKYKIISLGWDCFSRTLPTWYGIKPMREQGELSYPFDLAMHTLPGILKILQNDFADYLEDIEFEEATKMWHNHKYHIKYNHDETLTSVEEFRARYNKRIENFYNIINNEKNVFFIYHTLPSDKPEEIVKLYKEVQRLRNDKNFQLIVITHTLSELPHLPHISLCYEPLPWENYSWWEEDHLTLQGVEFEHKIANRIIEIIKKQLSAWEQKKSDNVQNSSGEPQNKFRRCNRDVVCQYLKENITLTSKDN